MLSNTKKPEPLAAQAAVEQKTASKAEKPVEVSKAAEPKAEKSVASAKTYVQYQGKQISQEEAVEAVKAAWTGETIKTLELYVKPEDGAVYYVINGSETGKVTF